MKKKTKRKQNRNTALNTSGANIHWIGIEAHLTVPTRLFKQQIKYGVYNLNWIQNGLGCPIF